MNYRKLKEVKLKNRLEVLNIWRGERVLMKSQFKDRIEEAAEFSNIHPNIYENRYRELNWEGSNCFVNALSFSRDLEDHLRLEINPYYRTPQFII